MSLFRTTSTAVPPTPPTPPPELDPDKASANPDTDTDTEPETKPETPEAPIVKMPDGTEVPVEQYVKTEVDTAVNKELAKVNGEYARIREMNLKQEEPSTETPTAPSFNVEVEEEGFQSDIEKSLVDSHNELGTEFGKTTQTLGKVEQEVEKLRAEQAADRAEARAQREIAAIEKQHGVTEAELEAIYNEYNGGIENLQALAEIAVSRKAESDKNEETRSNAQDERRESASKISGGGNAQPKGNDDPPPPGRGLSGKDIYDGEKIAAKYSAFTTRS